MSCSYFLREASYFPWLKKLFASWEIVRALRPSSMDRHPDIKIGIRMMPTQKRRKYAPKPLRLLPAYVLVLVINVPDDCKTSPLPDLFAIPSMLTALSRSGFKTSSKARWRRYTKSSKCSHIIEYAPLFRFSYALPSNLTWGFETTSNM